MPQDPEFSSHIAWLGYIQPVGLVVSPYALHQAQPPPEDKSMVTSKELLVGDSLTESDEAPIQ